jgi:hypothetical protein
MDDLIPDVFGPAPLSQSSAAPVREWDAVMSAKGELAKSVHRNYPSRDNVREEL